MNSQFRIFDFTPSVVNHAAVDYAGNMAVELLSNSNYKFLYL